MSPDRDPRFAELDEMLGHRPRLRKTRSVYVPQPCSTCGAADGRDPQHAAGCPQLAPLTKDELVRLARQCEEGWRREI